jgi:hypothetical protein
MAFRDAEEVECREIDMEMFTYVFGLKWTLKVLAESRGKR